MVRDAASLPRPDALHSGRCAYPKRDLALVAVVMAWVSVGLVLDAGADIWEQRAIGGATWLLLLLMLQMEGRAQRTQVMIAVVLATVGEFALSPVLGLYTYRLGNIPAFVPPGHGLVYLAALATARSAPLTSWSLLRPSVMLAGGAWALWGLALAQRPDSLGALLFVLFVAFLLRGRMPMLFAAAWLLTSYLELLGTSLGNWRWAADGPGGLIPTGNPPSGVCAVYCVLDALAFVSGAGAHGRSGAGDRAAAPAAPFAPSGTSDTCT